MMTAEPFRICNCSVNFKFGFIGALGAVYTGVKGAKPLSPKRMAGGVGGGRRNTSVYKNPKYLVAAYKCR